MKQYLLSIYQPDGPPPPPEILMPVMRDVNAVRQDMQAAGVWVFAGGLHPPSTATVVRVQGGELVTTDGPFTEGKEHIGGFCIVRAADLDSALGWGTETGARDWPADRGPSVPGRPLKLRDIRASVKKLRDTSGRVMGTTARPDGAFATNPRHLPEVSGSFCL